MKEPAIGAPTRDETAEIEVEKIDLIWSELDFISNGDLKDIFASSDNGLGVLGAGHVKKVDDATLVNGVGREEIGVDFWTRKEAKDYTLEHQPKMDVLLKVKEERTEAVSPEGILTDGHQPKMNELMKVKEEPIEVMSHQGIVMDGLQRTGSALLRVKEEQVTLEHCTDGRVVTGLAIEKQEDRTNQNGLPEGTGAVLLKVKEEQATKKDECQVAEVMGPLEDTRMNEVEQTTDAIIVEAEFVDLARKNNQEEGTAGASGAIAEILSTSAQGSDEAGTEGLQCSVSAADESIAMVVETPQYEVRHAEVGCLLKDGVLSSHGLAKMGMVLTDDSSSEEDSESSEEEGESESDDSSDDSSSEEEEDLKIIKEKIRKSSDETKEDTEPPRTKNELSVLPPVPKIEAVLEPHHVCCSTGIISSVVDRCIVVEGKDESRVLGDGSILWLTEGRVPLGIIDEVFGPVKKPYYSLRLNEVSDIPESAKVGADVAYVSEFAEFVLKDNPSLYKKAIDASGLDDEELSDAEIEFSDDEKEMAAKQRERGKRGHDSKENAGQARDSSDSQPPEAKGRWQRRERGRGRGHSRGPHMAEGVDSAMADMDLRGSSFSSGSMNHRGRAGARPGGGRSNFQSNIRQSNSGGWDGQDLGATYSRLHDGLSRGDWVPSPTRHSSGAGPSANGGHHQMPMPRRDERDGPWYSEQVDLGERQPHQGVGIQGPSFGVASLHRHLQGPGAEPRQPVGSGYPAFGYSSFAAPQIATDGQGNFFHITGPVNLPPDVGNVSRMGMNVGPTMVSVLPPSSSNSYSLYNSPVQGTLNVRQGGYDPVYQADVDHRGQHAGFMGPSPGYSSRIAAPEFRFQAMSSNSPIAGPGGAGGQGSGYALGSPPHSHRQRYQGSRGR